MAGALGEPSKNLKSDHFTDSEAPNIMSASSRFSSKNESGSKLMVKESSNPLGLFVFVVSHKFKLIEVGSNRVIWFFNRFQCIEESPRV